MTINLVHTFHKLITVFKQKTLIFDRSIYSNQLNFVMGDRLTEVPK